LLQAKDGLVSAYGFITSEKSDYAKAISEFERSRDLFIRLGNAGEAAIAESWAAQFLPEAGKVAEGERRLAAILANARGKNFKLLIPMAYYWLGVGEFFQNRLTESRRDFKTALVEAEAANNSFEADHAAETLALHYTVLGEFGTATSFASRMLSFTSLYRENSGQSKRDLGTLAMLSLKLEFLSTSYNFSIEKLNLVRGDKPTTRTLTDSLRNIVYAASARGDFPTALQYANESLAVASKDFNPENTKTIAQVYLTRADVEAQMKQYAQAIADYDQSLSLYRQQPEWMDDLYRIHKGKLLCFQKLNEQQNFAAELKTVMTLSEQYRTTIREDESRQAFFANEQIVFDLAMDDELRRGDKRAAYEYAEASRARSLLDFVESGKSIAEAEQDFGAVAKPLSLDEIQAKLPAQIQLVQYAALSDRLVIWIVTKTELTLIEKPITAAELERKVAAYQTALVSKSSAADLQPVAKELYEVLIPPGLAKDKQLFLVPDKALHQLAFASLVSPAGRFLLQDFALSYAPSASVMVIASEIALRKQQFDEESILSVGNPDYQREENLNLPDLESAEIEARTIAADYSKAVPLVGSKATKAEFLRNFASMEVIHFAGHFVTNSQSSANSKLLFAEGTLRSAELSAYKLPRAKLVVLSACETGFEHYNQSEGAIGIARTFLALGAPLVVASQWKVDTEPTKDLMIAFHQNRTRKRMTTIESLRQAQLEVLAKGETRAPFYWAAFSLFGGYANY